MHRQVCESVRQHSSYSSSTLVRLTLQPTRRRNDICNQKQHPENHADPRDIIIPVLLRHTNSIDLSTDFLASIRHTFSGCLAHQLHHRTTFRCTFHTFHEQLRVCVLDSAVCLAEVVHTLEKVSHKSPREARSPFRIKYFGQVPPKFENVLSNCTDQYSRANDREP